jgi:hypothetical protein
MIKLTERDLQLIIESLLYTSCPEVNITPYKQEIEDMFSLAVKLRKLNPSISTKNTFLTERSLYNNFLSQCEENFPELVLN